MFIYILIRWPHGNRIKTLAVNENRRAPLETALLTGAALGTALIPMVWVTTGFPAFADYSLHPLAFTLGIVAMAIGNWLFYRSHADLGIYWSPTLQMRENHLPAIPAEKAHGVFKRRLISCSCPHTAVEAYVNRVQPAKRSRNWEDCRVVPPRNDSYSCAGACRKGLGLSNSCHREERSDLQ